MLWASLCWASDLKILRWGTFWGMDDGSLLSVEKDGGGIDSVCWWKIKMD